MSLWFASALCPEGWRREVRITLEGSRILAVEPGVPARDGDERYDAAVPGMPNVHSHAFQRGMAGLSESRGSPSDSFWTWRQTMYRFLDRLTPEDVEAIAALAYAEMLERGFTRVGEFHYLHNDPAGRPYANKAELAARIVASAETTGIGLTLLPCFYAHASFGGLPFTEGQRRFATDLDGFARLISDAGTALRTLPDANSGVAPHSLRAVTPDQLRQVAALGAGGPIHIHAAEQTKEVEDCLAWSGRRPVAWLLDEMALDATWCLIHATHMTPDETARLAASGATVGLCPITEANLGDGIFPAPAFAQAGGFTAIGTDSNVRIDMPMELAMLEYAQRLTGRSRNVMADETGASTGRSLFDRARTGGARALGLPVPQLEPGVAADLVALSTDLSAEGDGICDRWIFGAAANPVRAVWRQGRQVVTEGRHVARDAIEARYRTTLARMLAT